MMNQQKQQRIAIIGLVLYLLFLLVLTPMLLSSGSIGEWLICISFCLFLPLLFGDFKIRLISVLLLLLSFYLIHSDTVSTRLTPKEKAIIEKYNQSNNN